MMFELFGKKSDKKGKKTLKKQNINGCLSMGNGLRGVLVNFKSSMALINAGVELDLDNISGRTIINGF